MKYKVIIRNCREYNPERIAGIIGEGMEELGARPRGRVLIKPNVVIAHRKFFRNAYTRPEFLEGMILALKARGEEVKSLEVGEKCGITIPTRYAFFEAGYRKVLRRQRVKVHYFDEEDSVEVRLGSYSLRDRIFVPEPVVEADYFVNLPKFKAHPWTKVTFSLKNYIGIQDDRHRLMDHDYMLERKIVDLYQVRSSDFIAIDGIVAGERTMLTPDPFPLGLIIMGTNQVAVDAVSTHIAGLSPEDVEHIRIAHEKGYGPIALDEIEITGDVSLEEAMERAKGFRLTLDRIDRIFNGKSNLNIYPGPPPEPEVTDYCWGGCPGALFEAMQIIKQLQPDVFNEIKKLHIVFGNYRGEINAGNGEKVIFMGDCARFKGKIRGKDVEIPFIYRTRDKITPENARGSDIVAKMVGTIFNLLRSTGKTYIRAKGCPVSVAENVLYLAFLGRVKNPYFHPSILPFFVWYYFISKLAKIKNRIKRKFKNKIQEL